MYFNKVKLILCAAHEVQLPHLRTGFRSTKNTDKFTDWRVRQLKATVRSICRRNLVLSKIMTISSAAPACNVFSAILSLR